jgi:hypothetical protein
VVERATNQNPAAGRGQQAEQHVAHGAGLLRSLDSRRIGRMPAVATVVSLVVAGGLPVLTVRSFAYSSRSRDEERATI